MFNRRQDHNVVIELLSQLHPRCFFANPKQRRPLKKDIVDDLEKLRDPTLAGYNIEDAIDWYTGHIGYDYSLRPGLSASIAMAKLSAKLLKPRGTRRRNASGLSINRLPNAVVTP